MPVSQRLEHLINSSDWYLGPRALPHRIVLAEFLHLCGSSSVGYRCHPSDAAMARILLRLKEQSVLVNYQRKWWPKDPNPLLVVVPMENQISSLPDRSFPICFSTYLAIELQRLLDVKTSAPRYLWAESLVEQ